MNVLAQLAALVFAMSLIMNTSLAQSAPTPARRGDAPSWDMKKLSGAPKTRPATGIKEDGVKGIFFDGPRYQGRPTRVFAWVGIPKTKPGEKVPGIVLVHGGGGTAIADWVRLWNARGYAAIAMDTCGNVPVDNMPASKWKRHDHGGPGGVDWNPDRAAPEDQWTYQAVSDVILAHSLLRSLPGVDPNRIGLTGASWGGYVTCIAASVDHRFKFAAPVYGCGFYLDTVFGEQLGELTPEQRDRWMSWWDPSVYLAEAPMPFLWVTGSTDFAYTFSALQKSYRLPRSPRILSIPLVMEHGGKPAQTPEEIRVFAESIFNGGDPLPHITGQGREGGSAWVTYSGKVPVATAELNFTNDTGKWQDRKWEAIPAQIPASGRVEASVPEGAATYYFNLHDERGCVVSSEHVSLP